VRRRSGRGLIKSPWQQETDPFSGVSHETEARRHAGRLKLRTYFGIDGLISKHSVALSQFVHSASGNKERLDGVHAVTGAAFEAITVEQRHEKLEVFLLAVVGCSRH